VGRLAGAEPGGLDHRCGVVESSSQAGRIMCVAA
jgi:hypothetical protein